ncbi:hypothetical protein lacNasYZ03_03970 [Lactobacillus nasalidis]|uniref:Uncharacterized protein n=1 Tax=Lactobacillus nasalidis TaxID=2797258 RepID=A0ABQ3W2Z1_9LACO|nr:hypothetical protein lacNasYZ01_12790 [Lactobacillus nasalidis]GHV99655.1 hypothetical protein lacNasYZ02_10850 [Lactobacillus nasalidis]GHW00710.1 hypothetical protein lacNasYZ03_03970 [Lactobacillus nasalidis]
MKFIFSSLAAIDIIFPDISYHKSVFYLYQSEDYNKTVRKITFIEATEEKVQGDV